MKYRKYLLLSVLLATSLSSLPAIAAVKAGATCPKVGKVVVKANSEFRCVKKGKKLVWAKQDKKVALPAPVSSPTPSPTPSVFTPPPTPTSFADLEKYSDGISYGAWLKSKQAMEGKSSKLGKLEIFVGPNSSLINTIGSKSLEDVSRMFSRASEPRENYVLIYGLKDIEWANKKIAELVTEDELRELQRNEGGRLIESNCPSLCTNAKQQTSRFSMKSLILIGADYFSTIRGGDIDKFREKSIWIHEYFHAIQRIPLLAPGVNPTQLDWPPTWFSEGSASYVENVAQNFDSFDNYKLMLKAASIGENMGVAWFEDFLDEKYLGERWSQYGYRGVYEVGMEITEILVSVKGPESIMDLYSEMARRVGFLAAFEKIYGVKWSEAKPVIARILAARQAANR